MTELVNTDTRSGAAPLDAHSLVWRWFGDNRMYLIGPRPAVIAEHARRARAGRAGSLGVLRRHRGEGQEVDPADHANRVRLDADNDGLKVRDFHTDIMGDMPDGSRYHALNPETYFWAHATFVEQVIYFVDTFVRRLTDAEKEQIWQEGKTWYRRYGVSDRIPPDTYADFQKYWDTMMDTVVVPHKTAAYGVGYVTKGFPAQGRITAGVENRCARVQSGRGVPTTGGMPPRAQGTCWACRGVTVRSAGISASPPSGAPGRSTPSGTGCRCRCATTFARTGYARKV